MPDQDVKNIDDLIPDDNNARTHTERGIAMLVDALETVGPARSIVVDENDQILAGNATVKAAAEAGFDKVEIVEADGKTLIAVRRTNLTDEQKTLLKLFDNRTGELSGWAAEVLADELNAGVELNRLFNEDELNDLLAHLSEVPSLDELVEEYGEHDEAAFWPVIRLQVSPQTFDQYERLMEQAPGENEAEKFANLIGAVDTALLGPDLS